MAQAARLAESAVEPTFGRPRRLSALRAWPPAPQDALCGAILTAARDLGLGLRVHTDQFRSIGGARAEEFCSSTLVLLWRGPWQSCDGIAAYR